MKLSMASMHLKTRAIIMTGAILLVVLGFNTFVNIYTTSNRYRDALMGKASILADAAVHDIDKATGFGIPLNALEGMSDNLKKLVEGSKDLSGMAVVDMDGKVLYASDRLLEKTTLSDTATKKALATTEVLIQSYSDNTGEHFEQVIPLRGTDGKKIGVFRISLTEQAVNSQIRSLLLWSSMVGLISFVAAVVLVYLFIDRVITRPITEMSKTASVMAAGDLSQQIDVIGSNEVADLGGAINTMSSNLREMLKKFKATGDGLAEATNLITSATVKLSGGARVQQESTEQTAAIVDEMVNSIKGVAENAEEMSRSSSGASTSASKMAASVEEVAKNTGDLVVSVEDTASSITEMIASIKQVSENTDAVSASAEQTSSSITEMSASVKEVEQRAIESARVAEQASLEVSGRGMASATEAIKGMKNIKETVEATAVVVNRLGKRSQEIGQILKVIDEVTDQTSLLALNAAILAAQAGEHGKGFAVVAEEIRDLAERTAASTQEISSLIASVREETAESVEAMDRGRKVVDVGVGLVNVLSEVLQQAVNSSRQSAEMARSIEKTTAEQAKGVAQITETSMNIAGQLERIAGAMQEQRRGSERIVLAVERMRDITKQVREATQDQTIGSRQIANAVESVTTQASQVARSTSEQSRGVQQISEAINRIQKITQDTVDMSVEMDMAVQTLKAKANALQAELEGFTF